MEIRVHRCVVEWFIVLLPEDAIMYISWDGIENWYVDGTRARYPLMFKLIFEMNSTYCSVKEFSAERGTCYIPRWVWVIRSIYFRSWRNLEHFPETWLQFGTSTSTRRPLWSFGSEIRPLTISVIPAPCRHRNRGIRSSLENKLKSFSVMARKDRILIEHLGKEYVVDIIDCQPNIVVDIVECDVEVDIEYKDLYRLKGDMMVERKRSRSFRKHQKPNQCQWTRAQRLPLSLPLRRTLLRFEPSLIRKSDTSREPDIRYALPPPLRPREWVDRDSIVLYPLGTRRRTKRSKLDSQKKTKTITLRVKDTGSAEASSKRIWLAGSFSVCHKHFQMALCRTASTVIPSIAYQVARASPVVLGHVTRLNNCTLPTVQKRTFILGTIINVSFGSSSWKKWWVDLVALTTGCAAMRRVSGVE